MPTASVTDAPSHETARPGAPLEGALVLVVDDETDGRSLVAEVLGAHGARVRVCDSAEEARAALQEDRPDLIISDIGMPHESGLDLMRSVRALGPELGGTVPAIALTGYSQESLRAEAISAGYDRHVSKPVAPSDLMMLAALLLQGRAAIPVDPDGVRSI
jgi:CheY-like chemotaxis protein